MIITMTVEMWNRKYFLIPVNIGATGNVIKGLQKYM